MARRIRTGTRSAPQRHRLIRTRQRTDAIKLRQRRPDRGDGGAYRDEASPSANVKPCRYPVLCRNIIREATRQYETSGLAPYLIGWRGYFGFCQTPRVLTNLKAWIRRRLRSYLWRQWGNGHNRFKELRRRGVSVFRAAVAAGSPTGFWRMSGHPAVRAALRNHHFDSLGLPRLYVPYPA